MVLKYIGLDSNNITHCNLECLIYFKDDYYLGILMYFDFIFFFHFTFNILYKLFKRICTRQNYCVFKMPLKVEIAFENLCFCF